MSHSMSTNDYCAPPWARPRRVLSQHRLLHQANAEVRALKEQLAATTPLARRRVLVHRLLVAGRRLSAILAALGLDAPPVPEPELTLVERPVRVLDFISDVTIHHRRYQLDELSPEP